MPVVRRYLEKPAQTDPEDTVDTLRGASIRMPPGTKLLAVGVSLFETTSNPDQLITAATAEVKVWLMSWDEYTTALQAGNNAAVQAALRETKKRELLLGWEYTATTEREGTRELESERARLGLPQNAYSPNGDWVILWFARVADDIAAELAGWYDIELPPRKKGNVCG